MAHGTRIECWFTAGLILAALTSAAVAQAVPGSLYVDCNAIGANNGTNWTDAYRDLQDALDFARTSGGVIKEINVIRGTYKPDRGTGDRSASFDLPAGVKVQGGWRLWEGEPYYSGDPTILSGNVGVAGSAEDNSYHVVTAGATTDSQTILEGFFITGGNASANLSDEFQGMGGGAAIRDGSPAIRNCSIHDNTAELGGGLACLDSQATIENCYIYRNKAVSGGGAFLNGVGSLTNCRFESNQATGSAGGGVNCLSATVFSKCWFGWNRAASLGGGLLGDAITVSDCQFYGNSAGSGGGGINIWNGATILRCTVDGNTSAEGGGIYAAGSTIITCHITNNTAICGMYGGGGGDYSAHSTWASCRFYGNSCNTKGGGLYCSQASSIYGCTFTGNTALVGGGLFATAGSMTPVVVDSSIIWGNTGGSTAYGVPNPLVTYSDIEGGCPGEGNIDMDAWPNGGYIPSPCVNAGNPSYVPLPEETSVSDLPRILLGRIDMGAYERPVGTLVGDIDADGCCDVVDLLYLVGAFGTYTGEPSYDFGCDFNEDGAVDVVDLLIFLENFGTCL